METRGTYEFETERAAREAFRAAGPTAKTAVREAAKAMEFDREEYEERVTPDVVETVRDVLFARRLAVTVGSREEFEAWRADTDLAVTIIGSEQVDNVAWHAVRRRGRRRDVPGRARRGRRDAAPTGARADLPGAAVRVRSAPLSLPIDGHRAHVDTDAGVLGPGVLADPVPPVDATPDRRGLGVVEHRRSALDG